MSPGWWWALWVGQRSRPQIRSLRASPSFSSREARFGFRSYTELRAGKGGGSWERSRCLLLVLAGSFAALLTKGAVSTTRVASDLANVAIVVYCALRIRQGRVHDDVPPPQGKSLRLLDNVVGAGGALRVCALGAVVWKNALHQSPRQASRPLLALLAFLGLAYVVASLGVALGQRRRFVAMAVLTFLVLLGVAPIVLFSLGALRWGEIGIVPFNLFALAFCVTRMRAGGRAPLPA